MSEEENPRFHDTKRLLKQYRRISYSIMMSEAEFCNRVSDEYGIEATPFQVNAEMAGIDLSNTKLENYAHCIAKNRMMLDVLDSSLKLLRSDPENGELMYQVLYLTYFTPQKQKNVEQVMQVLFNQGFPMSQSSYFNYLNSALKAYDKILWGYTSRDTMEVLRERIDHPDGK